MNSKLTFERRHLAKQPQVCFENRTYIDFIVDGISITELLGGVGGNIGKFGWNSNLDFEIKEFNDLQLNKSRLDNGMFSLYVCAECGDEGCGALMIRIERYENTVVWSDFFWSNGSYGTKDYPSNRVEIEPITFDRKEYDNSMDKLKEMIVEF